jgi:glucoamylase
MDRPRRRLRAGLLAGAGLVAALLLVSGDERADPRTPPALPGMPPPFLGMAVLGDGRLTAAVDAYGNVVDLRSSPAGPPLIDNPVERQVAGTVATDTGIQPWVRVGGEALPMWRADRIRQRYLPGTNVLRTAAWFDGARVVITQAAHGGELAVAVDGAATAQVRTNEANGVLTKDQQILDAAAASDRRWLSRARPLAGDAPPWAKQMYERSLLVLRALTDRRTGAVAAGARDGWAYVWPRDAGAVALAFAASRYRQESGRIARFLLSLDLEAAARFDGDGEPIPGRGPQGDAWGWTAVAARAAGLDPPPPLPWRDLPDYQEKDPGDYLGNALAAADGTKTALYRAKSARRLVRRLGDPESGLDSAAAWAVRPFSVPALHSAARKTMLRLTRDGGRFGITPGQDWPERDPWSAPTAWTAWSLAALGERRRALALMQALRRSATPTGALPERVDARTGVPRSTTPLAWSHAFAILALRELWPTR